MNPFKRKPQEDDYGTIARRRISRLATVDVLNWADQVGSGLAKALQDYRNAGTVDSLYEAETGSIALTAIVDELVLRETGQQ